MWTGTWSSGSITVDDASDYTIFLIRIAAPTNDQEPLACLAMRAGTDLGRIRGSGGHAFYTTGYPNGRWTYWVSLSISGDTLTRDATGTGKDNVVVLYQGDASYFRPAIVEIIGVI